MTTPNSFTLGTPKSLTLGFEEDIFINYDHDDNEAIVETYKNRGWVDMMHYSLEKRLTQVMGEKPKIWRDTTSMRGNDPLRETIYLRLAKTAFLVSVLSPSYVKSKWCKDELSEFYRRAAEKIKINNKSRIFKVVKTPVDDGEFVRDERIPPDLNELLKESLGYEFYEVDQISGKLREFWPELGQEYLTKFLVKLEDLVWDIRAFIKCQELNPSEPRCEKYVYLAETTPDLMDQRSDIKRTLQQYNYHVLPDKNLPLESQAFEKEVNECLEQSILSIHLVGTDHTNIQADSENWSMMELQHKLAAERVRVQHELAMQVSGIDGAGCSRLIWMPDGLVAQEESYKQFVNYLQSDLAVYDRAELLRGGKLEDLKSTLKKKLGYSDEGRKDEDKPVRIYLYCSTKDLEAVTPIKTYLESQKSSLGERYEVNLPFKEGTDQTLNGNSENLSNCDALMIFYGSAPPYSIEMLLSKLRKNRAVRSKPMLAKIIYVGGPQTEEKERFTATEAPVLKHYADFSPEIIQPFLNSIEEAKGKAKGAGA